VSVPLRSAARQASPSTGRRTTIESRDDAPGRTPDPADPIRTISAVTLATHDMARAVAFYEALGFRPRYGGVEASFTSFAVGSGHLNLIAQSPDRQWSWWGRVIFHVADVDALHARAVRHGLGPQAPPRDAEWGERYFHLTDPDGHELSFARPLEASMSDEHYRAGREVKRTLFGEGKESPVPPGHMAEDLLRLTDEMIFGRIYTRPGLDLRTRSMLTVGALVVIGQPEYLRRHLQGALHLGITPEELKEVIMHVALYAGAPRGLAALHVLQEEATRAREPGRRP